MLLCLVVWVGELEAPTKNLRIHTLLSAEFMQSFRPLFYYYDCDLPE